MFNFRFEEVFPNLGTYKKQLKCYPVIMMPGKQRDEVNKGGKIILPTSALDYLTRLHIEFPMLFKLTNEKLKRETHCGVLEFIAEEGRCYLPYWMMKNLMIREGEIITVEYTKLQVAEFAKFQPQSVDFLEISNPKAVLENTLRHFACLSKGDVISINYNDKDYEVCILETRPRNAVSIIECDMDVDFAPPVGYQEPVKPSTSGTKKTTFNPLTKPPEKIQSQGYRLDGKDKKKVDAHTGKEESQKGVPFYDYKIGLLRFHHNFDETAEEMEVESTKSEPTGYRLKDIGTKA
ncbi:ubiquitin fusion degradation 1 -like protein [Brachionus plicatilis]|uniref:Ubiquitin fusion degradation 1-like protein n=1 Tax=Brachionus plicatilis TaxID=10195 RepID=A0A3M7Q4A6_BRAPC|nr:ubiquitin fusion degradation 1 -like protein [Brachionus plicatilis]